MSSTLLSSPGSRDEGEFHLKYYERFAKELAKKYERKKVTDLHRLLLFLFPPGTKVLELGCGSGRDSAFLLQHGVEVTGVEGAKQMAEEAKKYHPELSGRLLLQKLPSRLPFAGESFDGVFSIALLMHFSPCEVLAVFKEVERVLVKKGKFFFSVSLERPVEKERRFYFYSLQNWWNWSKKCNFSPLSLWISSEPSRPLVWGNFLWEKL